MNIYLLFSITAVVLAVAFIITHHLDKPKEQEPSVVILFEDMITYEMDIGEWHRQQFTPGIDLAKKRGCKLIVDMGDYTRYTPTMLIDEFYYDESWQINVPIKFVHDFLESYPIAAANALEESKQYLLDK